MDNYRAIVEVLKLAEAKSVLLQYCEVSKLWGKAGLSSELWDSFIERELLPCRPAHCRPLPWYQKVVSELTIPVVTETVCTLYTLPNLSSRDVLLQSPCGRTQSSVYVFLSVTKLLCAGGNYSNCVREIDLHSGTVVVKSPLLEARNWTGIVKYEDTVYILGGSNHSGQLATGEKLTPKQGDQWTYLRGTLTCPRNGFTPFTYKEKIYCVGRCNTIETMALSTELFTVVPGITLPTADFWTLSFQYEEGFIVVQKDLIAKYTIGATIELVSTKSGSYYRGYWSNFPPVRYGHCFYSILNPNPREGFLKVDAAAMTYEKVLSLPSSPAFS